MFLYTVYNASINAIAIVFQLYWNSGTSQGWFCLTDSTLTYTFVYRLIYAILSFGGFIIMFGFTLAVAMK